MNNIFISYNSKKETTAVTFQKQKDRTMVVKGKLQRLNSLRRTIRF